MMRAPGAADSNPVRVIIGPENVAEELRDSSVVMASYDAGEGQRGLIGVVGPLRMDYSAVAAKLSADTGLPIQIELVSNYPAQVFHPDCVDAVGRAAAKLGYSHMPAVSGAGHDAVYMAKLAPSGMIFIPCKDGISHNEIEDAQPGHLEAGCNVLLQAMLLRAGVAA